MSNDLDKYDSTSERLSNDATIGERLIKFTKIVKLLEKENIELVGLGNYAVELEDKTCGYKLTHGVASWEMFRVIDVVDMVVNMRNDYIKRKKKQ